MRSARSAAEKLKHRRNRGKIDNLRLNNETNLKYEIKMTFLLLSFFISSLFRIYMIKLFWAVAL